MNFTGSTRGERSESCLGKIRSFVVGGYERAKISNEVVASEREKGKYKREGSHGPVVTPYRFFQQIICKKNEQEIGKT